MSSMLLVIPDYCPEIILSAKGTVIDPKYRREFGAIVEIKCTDGYELTHNIVCQEVSRVTGAWRPEPEACTSTCNTTVVRKKTSDF